MAVPTGAESVTVTVDAAVQGVCARVRSRVHSLRVELQRTLMHHAALCEVDAEVLARQRCSGWDVQSHWLYRSAQRRHWCALTHSQDKRNTHTHSHTYVCMYV